MLSHRKNKGDLLNIKEWGKKWVEGKNMEWIRNGKVDIRDIEDGGSTRNKKRRVLKIGGVIIDSIDTIDTKDIIDIC